jgi:flagellar protein FlaG
MELGSLSDIAMSTSHEIQPQAHAASQPLKKAAPPPVEGEEPQANSKRMQRVFEDIQMNLSHLAVSLTFSTYGKNNNQVSIVVAEKETGKVIREIPSRELQSLSTKMQELVGMIFNKSA